MAFELALISWLGFLLSAYWFSTFGGRSPSVRLNFGAKLPHFTVKNTSGTTVSVVQLTDRPAVFMLFRGN